MNAPNQLVLKREKEGSAKLAVFFVALSAALSAPMPVSVWIKC